MSDNGRVAIVGGGVIGLSLAWELSRRGRSVTVFESGRVGRKASWAGAGILAPANALTSTHPLDRLMGLGSELHLGWSQRLLAETRIDNGYVECGGLYVARSTGEKAALRGQNYHWENHDIPFRVLDSTEPLKCSGPLKLSPNDLVVEVPGESQICNPDHLKALSVACARQGVELVEDCQIEYQVEGAVVSLQGTGSGKSFEQVCFCTGAWTTKLLEELGVTVPLIPVRGQMLLFKLTAQTFEPIINEGSRYIVPRQDGYVLVGSTTEEVGFDESTTDEKQVELMTFASSLVPSLNESTLVKRWAGLRPASHDGFPFMGALPGIENGFVAAGHFKAGLQVSPVVAVIMADLLEGKATVADVEPFSPGRLDLSDSLQNV